MTEAPVRLNFSPGGRPAIIDEEIMATCVTCGDELHPDRAEKYNYCTKRECRHQNAKALPIVAVGVNKAADQFVVLDERTEKELASGRYKKVPETPASIRRRSRPQRVQTPDWEPTLVPRSSARPAPPDGARHRRTWP